MRHSHVPRDTTGTFFVQMGERGCIAARGARRWSQEAFATEVIDATGAGDAFNAGFLSAYLGNASDAHVQAALRVGAAAGAAAVGKRGACEPPIRGEHLERFLTSGSA